MFASRGSWLDRSLLAAFLAAVLAGCRSSTTVNVDSPSLLAYVAYENSTLVGVYDVATRAPAGAPIQVGDSPVSLAIDPRFVLNLYVLNQRGNSVSIVDRLTRSVVGTVFVGRDPAGMAVSPDGYYLFVTSPTDRTVTRINVRERIADQTLKLGTDFKPSGIVASPSCARTNGSRYAECQSLDVYVTSEEVITEAGSASADLKVGKVQLLRSQAGSMTADKTFDLAGAEHPFKAAIDHSGKNLFVTDTDLSPGIWRIDLGTGQAERFGTSTPGAHDVEVAGDGTVYATLPGSHQYAEIRSDGAVLVFPEKSRLFGTEPRPLALSSGDGELWIGFGGSGTVAVARYDGGRAHDLEAVYLGGPAPGKPSDILLAPGLPSVR